MNERNFSNPDSDVTEHASSRKLGHWIGWFGLMLLTFSAGYLYGVYQKTTVPPQEAIQQIVRQSEDQQVSEEVDFSLYWDVWNRIKRDYVRQPVDEADLFYGSVAGLVRGAGDPYSVFFSPDQTESFNDSLNGSFGGVGIELGAKDGQVVVIAPLPDTPAERNGVLASDVILAVDDEYIDEETVEEVVFLIRGEVGTDVTLLLQRNGDEPFELTLTREVIQPDTVKVEYQEREGKTAAIITVSQFTHETSIEFRSIVNDLILKSPDVVILDLRNNPGGFVDAAVDIASEWIPDGAILLEQTQDGRQVPSNSTGSGRLSGQKTIVLINQGSASASEIVAGALQDRKKATILGEISFGKGSVQDVHYFADGSSLKLTISLWLTPDGRMIDKTGIEPDQVVPMTAEDYLAEKDPQLDAAFASLNQ
ncbi:MAG: S41 family peptidase [Patescibacteria group bacterium]